jgi:predicted dehydrogenase
MPPAPYTGVGICYNSATHMIAAGELGEIQKIDVQYYQGWINPVIHDPEIRKTVWRLDPKKAGISSCMGDIGTHAFQMTEYLTGMEVGSLLSDLNMLYENNSLDLDGTVLIRFSETVKGVVFEGCSCENGDD